MTVRGLTFFDTPIGSCGLAWGPRGITGVQLPEADARATRTRLRERFPDSSEAPPPAAVRQARDAIRALLRGESCDLSAIALDMERVPAFHRRVYEAARAVPYGATVSYGEIAHRIGAPGAARAVGQALGRNPFAIIVPCHRVLAAGGKTGGFSASGGVSTKLRMLAIEGATAGGRPARPAARGGGIESDPAARGGGLGFDPDIAVAHLRAVEPALARVIDDAGPFRPALRRTTTVFAALAEAIVYQQLSGKAAATIYGRFRALFRGARRGPTPEHVLGASDARLRSAGLSHPKILALRDLARRTADGALPTLAQVRRLDDEAIVERLTAVRGIGRWTVEMLLIFRLGRPDVLPADDYGIRRGFAVTFKKRALPAPVEVLERGARWQPYRTVASWYLWRAAERARGR